MFSKFLFNYLIILSSAAYILSLLLSSFAWDKVSIRTKWNRKWWTYTHKKFWMFGMWLEKLNFLILLRTCEMVVNYHFIVFLKKKKFLNNKREMVYEWSVIRNLTSSSYHDSIWENNYIEGRRTTNAFRSLISSYSLKYVYIDSHSEMYK